MSKSFSKSKIVFNNELVSSAPDTSQTREELRSAKGISIKQIGSGIGYQETGTNNEIG